MIILVAYLIVIIIFQENDEEDLMDNVMEGEDNDVDDPVYPHDSDDSDDDHEEEVHDPHVPNVNVLIRRAQILGEQKRWDLCNRLPQ